MKRTCLLPLTLLLFFSWKTEAQSLEEFELLHQDSVRSYKFYVPDDYIGEEPWPLVIVLHGYSLTNDVMIDLTGMNTVADTAHFLAAYPQGLLVHQAIAAPPFPTTAPGWNLGHFFTSDNDDVGFLSKMIDKISLSYRVDPARVYVCGLSNGGQMANKLACELSGRIAAVADISGSSAESVGCTPERPVPMLFIHGTGDPIVPFYDGTPGFIKPIQNTVDFWADNNACDAEPEETALPDIVPSDNSTVILKKYYNCNAGTEIWFYQIENGGHAWPGQLPALPPFLGVLNEDFNASVEAWNFFNRHVHPDPLVTQFPWHAPPVPNPFGLNEPPLSVLRLVDFDLDDTTEAIVVASGGIIGTNVEYYENTGDDAAPNFVYVESYPFGIPQLQSPQMDPFEFIDIDGDGDPDIFLHYQGLETPLAFLENTGTPGAPWFGDSQVEFAPFGFMAPLSDSIPGSTLGNSLFSFVDIDADNDYDLFFGGHFLQNGDTVLDENLYFYRNEDNSGKGTAPHFAPPEKNPFHLSRPLVPDGLLIPGFVDIDCDGDWDLFETYANIGITFLENTGTPDSPDFNKPPVAWWADDPPPPPGFDSYALGDWIDIGGDGDMDYIGGSVPGFFFWENVSNNAMACRGFLPEISSSLDAHLDANLTLYPNPAQDWLAFDLQSNDPIGEVDIEIFNVLAQRVRNLRRQGFAHALQENIPLESLADGIYTIRLSSGGKFIVQQFVKI